MNLRIQKLREGLHVEKYPLCVEKMRLITESFRQTEGDPQILRRAKALANVLNKRTIFIDDGELIVGNVASKLMGFEIECMWLIWSQHELDGLKKEGFAISEEDEAELRALNEYWKGKTFRERMAQLFDDERLWPFMQSGMLIPPWKKTEKTEELLGYTVAGSGWGFGGSSLNVPDYAKVLNGGLNKIIEEAEEELRNIRFTSTDSIKKAYFLKSVIIAHKAVIRIANRFADLATEMAAREGNPTRKNELERIAETCRWVPAKPARTFYEAMQFFWFVFVVLAEGTTSAGRFDQYMYPFYKKDIDEERITNNQVLELLECLRIKDMQLNRTFARPMREKWTGMAKWHNFIIGGQTPDGKDSTNELSYLILEAAKDCQTPHHTVTVRVHEGTPEPLMLKALEVVTTGIGMPAFIGDKSYIEYLLNQGVPLELARDYAIAGCLDCNIMGRSRIIAFNTFIVPRVLEITMNNGVDPRTGGQLGLKTGDVESFKSFNDFMRAFKEQLVYFMRLTGEEHNLLLQANAEVFPDPFLSSLMVNAIKEGKDIYDRTMPFENGSVLNAVGMINVADSLAAIKKLIFDEKKLTMKQLKAALAANWQGNGYGELRKMFLGAPKYGNDDDYVDTIAKELYQFWAERTVTFDTIYGGKDKPAGISVSAHWPGGALTGATPDGRYSGESLADGTMSPVRGRDTHGPTGVIKSAMKIDQVPYQSTLLNMKFHRSALKTTDDLRKLADLIRIYFSFGGKHIQFNVINVETLLDAQKRPENYRDLIVRVAGYSAYFVELGKIIQDDIIGRTEHQKTA